MFQSDAIMHDVQTATTTMRKLPTNWMRRCVRLRCSRLSSRCEQMPQILFPRPYGTEFVRWHSMHVSLMFLVSIVLSLSCLLWELLSCTFAVQPVCDFDLCATNHVSNALDG